MSERGALDYVPAPSVIFAINGGWHDAGHALTPRYVAQHDMGAGVAPGTPVRQFPVYESGMAFARLNDVGAARGMNHLTGHAMLAEYDGGSRVWLLERQGRRHPWHMGWEVGSDITLLAAQGQAATGIVVRGSSIGRGALNDHYFIAATTGGRIGGMEIILHHTDPNAPDNSTEAFDPDSGGKRGLLSDSLRIRAGLSSFHCVPEGTGSPLPVDENGDDWVMLNGDQHGGGRHSGWLAVTFSGGEALMSAQMTGGPLAMAGPLHQLGRTREGRGMYMGSINAAGLIGRHGAHRHAPAEWQDSPEPDVVQGQGHRYRVDCLVDLDEDHFYGPGCKRKGLRRWSVVVPVGGLPPCKETQPQPPHEIIPGYDPPPDVPQLPGVYIGQGAVTSGITWLPTPEVI